MVCSTVDAGRLSGWQVPAALYGWAGLGACRKPAHPAPAFASGLALVGFRVVLFVFLFVFVFVLAAPALVTLGVLVLVVAPADVAFGVLVLVLVLVVAP